MFYIHVLLLNGHYNYQNQEQQSVKLWSQLQVRGHFIAAINTLLDKATILFWSLSGVAQLTSEHCQGNAVG